MNDYAICELSIVPVRAKASETSEMVTQLLFGETAKVLEVKDKWLKVELTHDSYTGWVDRKMISPVSSEDYEILAKEDCKILSVPYAEVITLRGKQLIPMGSQMRKGLLLNYKNTDVLDNNLSVEELPEVARLFLNVPYLWGGRTVFGTDCSGFTQLLYRMTGKNIPRDAGQQVKIGRNIGYIEKVKSGDLAFFGSSDKITHVGLIVDKQHIIHASGWVRIDTIDAIGIYNSDLKDYSHKLVSVKRLA
ncbi:NlpC/P60 family protein [Saccharicrinis sp. FJH2]|uniref:C40 family peptidase n=1 Tax=Saccharicrinis sp. FJH65 TaxID=3344659 RepID=UPI0035F3EED4